MRKQVIVLAAVAVLIATGGAGADGIWDLFKKKLTIPERLSDWTFYYDRNPDVKDPKYPVRIPQDGFKVIRAYRTEPRKTRTGEYPSREVAEWGWMAHIANVGDEKIRVKLYYYLVDVDGFELTWPEYKPGDVWIEPHDTVIVQNTSEISYDELERVAGSRYRIVLNPRF